MSLKSHKIALCFHRQEQHNRQMLKQIHPGATAPVWPWSGCSALPNPCFQRIFAQGDTEVFMVPRGCLCILEHGILNLQRRCLGSCSVSWYLPARVRCSPPSAACLICLCAVYALLNWRVSSCGFRIKSLLWGASYSCASDFNTAQCLSLDLLTPVSVQLSASMTPARAWT